MIAEPVLKALDHVWNTLAATGNAMAVMGGIALSVWKHPRFTQDVDLLVAAEIADVGELIDRVAAAGIRTKHKPPLLTLGPHHLIQLIYEPPNTFLEMQIDVLLADSAFLREALQRRVLAQLPGLKLEIAVLRCEDLVLLKLLAGRVIDRVDSATLLRLNRSELDVSYVLSWVEKLKLRDELAVVWDEAFPGESLPLG